MQLIAVGLASLPTDRTRCPPDSSDVSFGRSKRNIYGPDITVHTVMSAMYCQALLSVPITAAHAAGTARGDAL